ncbi:MAG TPA: SIMPL domain-containing protein [Gemmatimonadaceae bacterium]|nr:SIMPL domain-containing protein [Gemmatimonadaceae bacterium]
MWFRLLIASALAGVAPFNAPATLFAQSSTSLSGGQPPSLVTSGQGEAKVTPDRVSVLVNVQTRAPTAAAAASSNAERTKAVLDVLGRLGLPKDQLSTEGYSAYPEMSYDRVGGTPKVIGYVVTNSVRAESKRIEQAGAIIDAALGAGANLINSLSFYASSIDEPRRQAIALAVSSAHADAEAMAQAAGGRLGALLELSTQGPTAPPRPMFDMAARGKTTMAEQTPINPGQQTVNVFVTARWTFVPRE